MQIMKSLKLFSLLLLAASVTADEAPEFGEMIDLLEGDNIGLGGGGGTGGDVVDDFGEYGFDDDGYGYGEGDSGFTGVYDESDYRLEDSDYGYGEGDYGEGESDYGYGESGYGEGEGDYGYGEGGYGYGEGDYGEGEGDYGYGESDYGFRESDNGFEDKDYSYGEGDNGYAEGDNGFEDSIYGYGESDYGFRESDNEFEDRDYGYGYGDYGPTDDVRLDTQGYEIDSEEVDSVETRSAQVRPLIGRTTSPEVEMEFEDGSVSAEEIPAGYFASEDDQRSRLTDNRLPRDTVTTAGIDLPGFRVIIGGAIQWWQYDHNVCLQKEFLRPREVEDEGGDSRRTVAVYSVRCEENSATKYSCVVSQQNGTEASTQRLTYTCCVGYTRLGSDLGCPRIVPSGSSGQRTFAELLRQRGYSQRVVELFGAILASSGNDSSRPWTVFVPAKESLDDVIDSVESREGEVPLESAGSLVRKLMNHFAQPAMTTRSMRHGQRVATLAKPSALLITKFNGSRSVLVNCQPITLPNQAFNRYSLVHFTTSVLTPTRRNLYQLMLARLENVTSVDNAQRLLAPLQSILTGPNAVTVFMHSPAAGEMEYGCYARNLRAVIVKGVECNASLSCASVLRTIDGKPLRIARQSIDGRNEVLIDGNRILIGADSVASNGVLHQVRTFEALTGFSNEFLQQLKSSPGFRSLFARPNRTEGDLVVLLPPINGSYLYHNTSARWRNATELRSFGRSHLLTNGSRLSGRLSMLNGVTRDFVQLTQQHRGASVLWPARPAKRRRLFVDCVPVVRTARDCGGSLYLLMQRDLPDFGSAPSVLEFLSSRGSRSSRYSMTTAILSFAIENNIKNLTADTGRSDLAIVLLKDEDLMLLSGRLRRPTREQMNKLTDWFVRYFVASRQVCAAKQLSPSFRVPAFDRPDRRPCRSFVCALRRQMTSQPRRVLLRPGGQLTVKEGFLLTGRLSR